MQTAHLWFTTKSKEMNDLQWKDRQRITAGQALPLKISMQW